MFGKGSLIIVIGFVMAFSIYQLKLSKAVNATTDNFNYYYIRSLVHEEALSAMNFGINKVWADNVTSANFTTVANGCTSQVAIYPSSQDTVTLKVKSWNYVFEDEYYAQHQQPLKLEDSVFAYFSYVMPISRYFWFTNNEANVYWVTGDTVWGPVHTNNVIRTTGAPVFYGKVTAYQGISPNPTKWTNKAKYYGGWEIGVYMDIPTDMSHLITAATTGNGGAPINTKCLYDQTTTFDFIYDGRVARTVGANPPDTVLVSDIAPTGVIYSTAEVRVKGVLQGQLTIYTATNVWIDDDIVYASNPLINPSSSDFLGLVAENNVYVTDNAPNNNNVNIQASMMAVHGWFTAENYASRPIAGALYVTGSIAQEKRGAVGVLAGWGGIKSGFYKRYHYDARLASQSPPKFPFVRTLSLVSWWE
jgi:hypothetical protein